MTKNKRYIGSQEILREKPMDDGMIQVVLVSDAETYPGMPEEEVVYYPQETLNLIITDEPNNDLSELRTLRCRKPISEIVYVLMSNAVKQDDLQHTFDSVVQTIKEADNRQRRKVFGVSEENENLYQLKQELLSQ